MGRREGEVGPGPQPVQELSRVLRDLKASAGLTYEQIADRSGWSKSTVHEAAGGRKCAAADVANAFVTVCGGDWPAIEPLWQAASVADAEARALPSPLADTSVGETSRPSSTTAYDTPPSATTTESRSTPAGGAPEAPFPGALVEGAMLKAVRPHPSEDAVTLMPFSGFDPDEEAPPPHWSRRPSSLLMAAAVLVLAITVGAVLMHGSAAGVIDTLSDDRTTPPPAPTTSVSPPTSTSSGFPTTASGDPSDRQQPEGAQSGEPQSNPSQVQNSAPLSSNPGPPNAGPGDTDSVANGLTSPDGAPARTPPPQLGDDPVTACPPAPGARQLSAVRRADGSEDVFGRSADGQLAVRAWKGGWAEANWTPLAGKLGSAPAVAGWSDGTRQVFARADCGGYQLLRRVRRESSWLEWDVMTTPTTNAYTPAVTAPRDYALLVAYVDEAGDLYARDYSLRPRTGWQPWEKLGSGFGSGPEVVTDANGALHVYARDRSGRLRASVRPLGGAWSDWSLAPGVS